MSELSYAGLNFSYVSTREFRQESVMDPSGADERCIKVRLVVQFVLSNPIGPAFNDPAPQFAEIREQLMRPRQSLRYANDTDVLINITQTDPLNGPLPQYCVPVIEHSMGSAAWVVEYCIECALLPCIDASPSTQTPKPFLTIRWSQSQDVDERGYSTIVTQGHATFNQNFFANNPATFPDEFRGYIVPGLIPGFTRKYHYIISEDNLEMSFQFVDEEMLYSPPKGFVKTTGKTTFTTLEGAMFWVTATSEVIGIKNTPKAVLVQRAVKIAYDKLFLFGILRTDDGGNKFIVQATIEADQESDTARAMFRARVQVPVPPGKPTATLDDLYGALAIKFGTPPSALGFLPGGKPTVVDVGIRGQSMLAIAAAVLGNPCDSFPAMSKPTILPPNSARPNPFKPAVNLPPNVVFVPTLPTGGGIPWRPGWDSNVGVTEVCHIEVDHPVSQGLIPLPVTGSLPNGNTVVAIQLNNPVMMRTFTYTIEKTGTQPSVPDVRSQDSNMVLLSSNITPQNIKTMEDGTSRYTLTGTAQYVILNPNKATIAYPIPPWFILGSASAIDYAVYFGPNGGLAAQSSIDPSAKPNGGDPFPV